MLGRGIYSSLVGSCITPSKARGDWQSKQCERGKFLLLTRSFLQELYRSPDPPRENCLITRHYKQPSAGVKTTLNSHQWDWELGCVSWELWSLLTAGSIFIFLTCLLLKQCYLCLRAGE